MKKIFTLLFMMLVLTACTKATGDEVIKNDYKFIGKSEHWKAEYIYKGVEIWGDDDEKKTYSNEDSYEFVLTYKGSLKELSSMRKLEYSYKTASGGGNRIEDFTEPPNNLTFTSGGGSKGGAKVSEDEVIQVNVKWDEFEESFELHNKNN
ncbi:membrane lipoprotein lipid attachment site-containing protein [Brevibacterium sp. JNUCC-42]|nr:membrane lipoprotein lipid attachment site-containing protein [Brevibacterium sp. JNUCC-42]